MSKEIIWVFDVGSSDFVDVIEVFVKKGDSVEVEDIIVVLEFDKVFVEVFCFKVGIVFELLVKVGDWVKEGDFLLELDIEVGDGGVEDDQFFGDELENELVVEKDQFGDNEQGEKEEKVELKVDEKLVKKDGGGICE